MAGCYALVGSSIGLRFSRDIMIYAARVFPKIAGLDFDTDCAVRRLGSPAAPHRRHRPLNCLPSGRRRFGRDHAASSNVDVPFVMAMQMARYILVLLVGPVLARAVARWTKS